MKVLQVHNFYQEAGGEDYVFAAECELLRSKGHRVRQYSVSNHDLEKMSGIDIAVRTLWNTKTFNEIRGLLQEEQPDIVHCHNTFPLISPAVYYAAHAAGVPVVQTLHNFRLLCPGSTFYRAGRVCEDCIHSAIPYRSIWHACYRHSRAASASSATMLAVHRAAGTWRSKIHTYIALTEFGRMKFIEGGLPAERVVVKPNFLRSDPGIGAGSGGYAVFVGRLVEEKGLRTLLKAWDSVQHIPLKIAGIGPLAGLIKQRAAPLPNIEYLGQCSRSEIFELLRSAAVLICPSEWYEGALPLSIIEALACGTPVVCSDLGSMNDLQGSEAVSVRFEAGNPTALADVIRSLFAEPGRLFLMRQGARRAYEERYTPEDNYEQLVRIYENATAARFGDKPHTNVDINPISRQ